MPPPGRQRTPSLQVRDALLRAARELLDQEGTSALSVREIANRARVGPMGVYKRFGSKNGILDALLVEGFHELSASLPPPPTTRPRTRATASLHWQP